MRNSRDSVYKVYAKMFKKIEAPNYHSDKFIFLAYLFVKYQQVHS